MEAADSIAKNILRLWEEYENAGGSQKAFSAKTGIAQGQLSNWLKGLKAGVVPKIESLIALSRGFDIPLARLLDADAAAPRKLDPFLERLMPQLLVVKGNRAALMAKIIEISMLFPEPGLEHIGAIAEDYLEKTWPPHPDEVPKKKPGRAG